MGGRLLPRQFLRQKLGLRQQLTPHLARRGFVPPYLPPRVHRGEEDAGWTVAQHAHGGIPCLSRRRPSGGGWLSPDNIRPGGDPSPCPRGQTLPPFREPSAPAMRRRRCHADWTECRPNHPLQAITSAWRSWAAAKGLISRVTETLRQPEPSAPLSPDEASEAAAIAFQALGEAKPYPLAPAPGQAFRLDLIESTSKLLPFHDQESLPCPPATNGPRSQTPSQTPASTSPCAKETGNKPRSIQR